MEGYLSMKISQKNPYHSYIFEEAILHVPDNLRFGRKSPC